MGDADQIALIFKTRLGKTAYQIIYNNFKPNAIFNRSYSPFYD